jgi:hypothetical protein
MSWDILYNRQFVKVNDTVIPMILSGSNNCYEISRNGGNGRRARDWWRHRYYLEGGALGIKPEDLEKKLDNELESYVERYKDEADRDKIIKSWGYYTAIRVRTSFSSTFNQYKAFYMNGCKEAMSVEDLVKEGVYISIGVYRYEDKDILKKGLEILPTVTVDTTEALIETYERYVAYYGHDIVMVNFHNEYAVERMIKRLRGKKNKPKNYVETNEFFVLKAIGEYRYYIKGIKRGYRYSFSESGAKKFLTEKKAKAFLKRIKYKDNFEVMKCNTNFTVSVLN